MESVPEPDSGEDPRQAMIGQRPVWFDIHAASTTPVFLRDRLQSGNIVRGPALVEQSDSTVVILPGQIGKVDPFGNLVIEEEL